MASHSQDSRASLSDGQGRRQVYGKPGPGGSEGGRPRPTGPTSSPHKGWVLAPGGSRSGLEGQHPQDGPADSPQQKRAQSTPA